MMTFPLNRKKHMEKRGRFAPTPSGLLHIGNAFTALMAWLQMRKSGGRFVLRIEDIDTARSKPEYTRRIIEDLRWLGLDWDEGPETDYPYGPYLQSERFSLYEEALGKLQTADRLYPCYCSRAELAAIVRAPHGQPGSGSVYPGICRNLSEAQRNEKSQRKNPSLRLIVPKEELALQEGISGWQQRCTSEIGDFILKRADGYYSYQLAVVADDAAMHITDVLRGSDLLPSTYYQLILFHALGLTPPDYYHIPLLYAPDGKRFSKRNQSLTLASLRSAGVRPQTLLGCFAYLAGLLPRPEPVEAAALIPFFHTREMQEHHIILPSDLLLRMTKPGSII